MPSKTFFFCYRCGENCDDYMPIYKNEPGRGQKQYRFEICGKCEQELLEWFEPIVEEPAEHQKGGERG
jgi:hypothetical protein